jgi:hypothetical protein
MRTTETELEPINSPTLKHHGQLMTVRFEKSFLKSLHGKLKNRSSKIISTAPLGILIDDGISGWLQCFRMMEIKNLKKVRY